VITLPRPNAFSLVAFPNLVSRNCRGNATSIATNISYLIDNKGVAVKQSFEPVFLFWRKHLKVGGGTRMATSSPNLPQFSSCASKFDFAILPRKTPLSSIHSLVYY
jgi:hypothetical protein